MDLPTGSWNTPEELAKVKAMVAQTEEKHARAKARAPFIKTNPRVVNKGSGNNRRTKNKYDWDRGYCKREMGIALGNSHYMRAIAFGIAVLVASGEKKYKTGKDKPWPGTPQRY